MLPGGDHEASFSTEEVARFSIWREEGYDLPNQRYRQWLQTYNPGSTGEETGVALATNTDPGESMLHTLFI